MNTNLVRLIYHSRVAPGVSADDIARIFKVSAEWNQSVGVGGMLFSDGLRFIQMIEGSRRNISLLFKKIINDRRHHDVTMVSLIPILERRFDDWGMSLIKGNDENVLGLIRSMTSSDQIIPENMTADELDSLLLLFIKLANTPSLAVFKKQGS